MSVSVSIIRPTRILCGYRAIPFTTRRGWLRITSFTTASTGCSRAITGMRAAGTTVRGVGWVITRYRFIFFACRFATTASLRRISATGMPTRRHVGGIAGVATGNSVEAAGTVGTTAPPRLPHRCPLTSGIIRATAILAQSNSSIRYGRRIIATSRVSLSHSSITSRVRSKTRSASTTNASKSNASKSSGSKSSGSWSSVSWSNGSRSNGSRSNVRRKSAS